MIAQGDSYMAIGGQYNKTTVQILNGVNSSTTKDRTPEKIDDKGTDDPSDDEVVSAPRPLTQGGKHRLAGQTPQGTKGFQ
jgi:hypothetical protein